MKKFKIQSNHILAILFLVFIFFFFFANLHIVGDALRTKPSEIKDASAAKSEPSVEEVIKSVNALYNTDAYLKYQYINLNGVARVVMDQRTMNDVVKLNNGYLALPVLNATKLMEDHAAKTVALYQYLASKGIDFLWAQTPGKICKYDKQLPESVSDYSNENIDTYLDILKSNHVPLIDFREEMKKDKTDYYACFFKTDHHWTLDTALYASNKLVKELNRLYDCNIDTHYTDKENYKTISYPSLFLGSLGKRVGNVYGSTDDFDLLLPKFDTNITLSLPDEKREVKGTFAETIVRMHQVDKKDYFNLNPYAVFYGYDHELSIQRNHNMHTAKKVLLVKDSFMLPVSAFLTLSISELDTIDLRKYTKETLVSYIEREQPDIVVFSLNPSVLVDGEYFNRLGV